MVTCLCLLKQTTAASHFRNQRILTKKQQITLQPLNITLRTDTINTWKQFFNIRIVLFKAIKIALSAILICDKTKRQLTALIYRFTVSFKHWHKRWQLLLKILKPRIKFSVTAYYSSSAKTLQIILCQFKCKRNLNIAAVPVEILFCYRNISKRHTQRIYYRGFSGIILSNKNQGIFH